MELLSLLTTLPLWYQYSFVTVLGLIIGSFLNVVIYRLNTGKSLAGASHCLSCAKPLRWYELFPVVSYAVLRGRCAGCGSYISARYVVVEGITALCFVLSLWHTGWSPFLFIEWVLLSVLVVIFIYDINHFIIPDRLVALLMVLGVGQLAYTVWQGGSFPLVWPIVAGSAVVFCFYAGLWKVSAGRWIGFGDAKLAAPLALFLSPLENFSFVVLSFWVGAAISVGILLLQRLIERGQSRLLFLRIPLTMKSEVPFAPFIIVAFLLVFYFSVSVLAVVPSDI